MRKPFDLRRRVVLRGLLNGAAVTVALPILDCMLDSRGVAFAGAGDVLPVCFGTWFWGLGLAPGFWEPKQTGPNYELSSQLQMFGPIKKKINIFSGMQVYLDGKVNQNHYSGAQAAMTGVVSPNMGGYEISLDQVVLKGIGARTRFPSIQVACDGDPKSTWSARGLNDKNPSEISPLALYTRIFGPDFKDPNAAQFIPDPMVMARRSALSSVSEQRSELMRQVGASDRARLDEYFSSVRDLEQKLDLELQKPAPLEACTVPTAPQGEKPGTVIEDAMRRHNLFADLLTHALACGQTRIFNLSISQGMSGLRKAGDPTQHHIYTHEEAVSASLGYQPMCRWFADQYMQAFVYLVSSLDKVREGSGTLLDRTVIFAFTDHGEARLHSTKKFPFFTAGSANGRLKTGYHIAAEGDTVSRVPLTIQQALGMSVGSWGTQSNQATNPFTEILG